MRVGEEKIFKNLYLTHIFSVEAPKKLFVYVSFVTFLRIRKDERNQELRCGVNYLLFVLDLGFAC